MSQIQYKSESVIRKKKILNLIFEAIIAALGISALAIKFFLVDGVIAFRAFTNDGNLFTAVVMTISVITGIAGLAGNKETNSRTLYFLKLASAVTEAVIFIVVMIGYLPFFDDNPAITPYHMFCLHVAVPVLSVVNFIFFQTPVGVIQPQKMLFGAIPIMVYGTGVVIAIKTGILPMWLVPYSFLDFDGQFVWFVLFALVVIMSFGYFWAWLFYRANLKASLLWYKSTDLEEIQNRRIRDMSKYEVVRTSLLLGFCAVALFLLMMSLMVTSTTTTKVQNELLDIISWDNIEIINKLYGDGLFEVRDGKLYRGETVIGDGTADGANNGPLKAVSQGIYYSVYVKTSALDPDKAAVAGDAGNYICVASSFVYRDTSMLEGQLIDPDDENAVYTTPIGRMIDPDVENALFTAAEPEYSRQGKTGGEKYHVYYAEPYNIGGEGRLVIYSVAIPVKEAMAQTKKAEASADITMAVVIFAVFAVLFILTSAWSRNLEKTVDYLKRVADDDIPEEPLEFKGRNRMSGLAESINTLTEKKRK